MTLNNSMNTPSDYSVSGSIRAEYEQDDGSLFWPWLQERLPADKYDACRGLPLRFVQQIHKVEWDAYVAEQVQERLKAAFNEAFISLVESSNSDTGIIFDEAWGYEPQKSRRRR